MSKEKLLCPICKNKKDRESTLCKKCYNKKMAKPENYINKICPICNNKFITHISQIKLNMGKYCSRECARRGSPTRKRNRLIYICPVCNKKVERRPSEIIKNKGNQHFCSNRCWYVYNQNENHHLWNGGQGGRSCHNYREWRKAVLIRDKGYCRTCHSRENIEVHHIERFGDNKSKQWDVDNGVSLCKICHNKCRGCEKYYEEILHLIASVPLEIMYV